MAQALLNFAKTYTEVSDKLALGESDSGDYIKLYFTKDGHIITHGTDYIPWGNGIIPIQKLPVSDSTSHDSNHLWDSDTIYNEIQKSFLANDAMRFKGTIGIVLNTTNKYTINGKEVDFPSSSAQVGDTYRVVSAGYYADAYCEVGDLLICITNGSSSTAATWTVAQTNINGQVSHIINNQEWHFYSNDSQQLTLYAPTSGGTQGQVLFSNGDTIPTWKNQASITAGDILDSAKTELLNSLTLSYDKASSTLVLKSEKYNVTKSTQIDVTKKALSTGTGLTMGAGNTYNGDVERTITLLAATYTTLGGVTADSKTITLTDGKLSITKNNVVNALGYDPDQVQQGWRPIVINNISIGDKNLNIVSTEDVQAVVNETETDSTLGFYLQWYNISTKEYETV